MNDYAILSNRKRAVIALVQSGFFLLFALISFLGRPKAGLLFSQNKPARDLAQLAMYAVITTSLVTFVRASKALGERLYFAFVAASAGFSFLRSLFGDARFQVAQYGRAGMLICAVLTGCIILRRHSE